MTIDTHPVERGVLSGKAIPTIATLLGGVLISGLLGITIAADKVLAPAPIIPSVDAAPEPPIPITARPVRPRGAVEVSVAPLQSVDGVIREVAGIMGQAVSTDSANPQMSAEAVAPEPIAESSATAHKRKSAIRINSRGDSPHGRERTMTAASSEPTKQKKSPAAKGHDKTKSAQGKSKGK